MVKKIFYSMLFLGIVPCNAALFTLFQNSDLGEVIVLALNILVCLIASYKMLQKYGRNHIKDRYAVFIIGLFILMLTFNFVASVISDIEFLVISRRCLSMVCVCAYYLYSIYCFEESDSLISSINRAILFLIIIGFVWSYIDFEQVSYMDNATTRYFKGAVTNRNSYAELTLFYIATNMYLWAKQRGRNLFYIVTTLLAIYTTFMTHSATASVCVVFLVALCVVYRLTKKTIPIKVTIVGYTVLFVVMIIVQSSNIPFLSLVQTLFNKSSGMTGRQDIWRIAWDTMKEGLLLGYGFDTEVLLNAGIRENDPHNGILYILITQGIIGLSVLALAFGKILSKMRFIPKMNELVVFMYIFVIVWLIRGLTESCFAYTHYVFWMALIVISQNKKDKVHIRRISGNEETIR